MALPNHHGDMTGYHGKASVDSPWRSLLAEEEKIWQKGGVQHLVSMATDQVPLTTCGDGESEISSLTSYGGTIQYIHGYFTNFEPRRCCLLLTSGQSSTNAFKLVEHSKTSTQVSTQRDSESQTVLPPVTTLTQKEFVVYHLTVLAAHFPVLSAPPPPSDHTPTSPPATAYTPTEATGTTQHHPSHRLLQNQLPLCGATNRQSGSVSSTVVSAKVTVGNHGDSSDDHADLSVIPTETMSDVLRQAFRLTRQVSAQLEKLVYEPYKKKSNAKILAEELVYQLSQLENNSHPYYNSSQFVTINNYTCWQREQRSALTEKLNRFWHLSLPSLRTAAERVICYHDNYIYLLRKLIRYEERLKHGSLPVIPTLPLSGASRRILLEFALRYGVGELFQRGVYLEYLKETFSHQTWYLKHTLGCVTDLCHRMLKIKVTATRNEVTLVTQCCSGLLRYCRRSLSHCGQMTHEQTSTQTLGVVVELTASLLRLETLLTGGATDPYEKLRGILKRAVTASTEKLYEQEKCSAAKHLNLSKTQQKLSPKLLNRLLTFMRDELATFSTQLGPIFKKFLDVGDLVTRSLYTQLMADVKVMFSALEFPKDCEEVDVTMVSLAYRLNQLDLDWGSVISPSQQTWRHDYGVFVEHLMAALYSHMTALVLQAIANDKFTPLEIPESSSPKCEGHFDGDSHQHGYHGYRSASVLSKLSSGSLTHSSNSPFQPFVRGSASSADTPTKAVHSTPLCENKYVGNHGSSQQGLEAVSPVPAVTVVTQIRDERSPESRNFVVSRSAVDVAVIIQRLIGLQRLLCDSLYPCYRDQPPTVKAEPSEVTAQYTVNTPGQTMSPCVDPCVQAGTGNGSNIICDTPKLSLHDDTSKEQTETLRGLRDGLVMSFIELIGHILDLYRVNMAAMDLCAVPLSTAREQFGQQFISQMWKAKSVHHVWGCRHMAEQLPKCLPDINPGQVKYLADCFTSVDQKMCVRLNNLIELSKVIPEFILKMAAPHILDVSKLPGMTNNSYCVRSDPGQRSFKVTSNDSTHQNSAPPSNNYSNSHSQNGTQPSSESDTGFSDGEHLTSKTISRSSSFQNHESTSYSVPGIAVQVKVDVHCAMNGSKSHGEQQHEEKTESTNLSETHSKPEHASGGFFVEQSPETDVSSRVLESSLHYQTGCSTNQQSTNTACSQNKQDVIKQSSWEAEPPRPWLRERNKEDLASVLSPHFTDTQTGLMSVSVGLCKLLTHRLHKYTSAALSLLLKLHPLSLDVTANFSPLGSYLRTNIESLRTWLSGDCFDLVTRGLYKSIAEDLERHATHLKSSPKTAEGRAKVLLRVIAYLLQEIKSLDSELSYVLNCWEAASLWLSMYSYPSWDLLCLFDTLQNMSQMALAADTQVPYRLHCRLFLEIQQQKKCFTEQELTGWISANLGLCSQTVQVLCPDSEEVSNPKDVIRALLESGLIQVLDSGQSRPSSEPGDPSFAAAQAPNDPGEGAALSHTCSKLEAFRSLHSPSRSEEAGPSNQKSPMWSSVPGSRRSSITREHLQPRSYSAKGLMWFGPKMPAGATEDAWLTSPEVSQSKKQTGKETRIKSDISASSNIHSNQQLLKSPKFYTLRDLSDWPAKPSCDPSCDTRDQSCHYSSSQSECPIRCCKYCASPRAPTDGLLEAPDRGSCEVIPGDRGSCEVIPGDRGSCEVIPGDRGSCEVIPGDRGSCEVIPGDLIQLQFYLERRVTPDLVLSILATKAVREEKTRELLKKLPPEMIKGYPWLSKSSSVFTWLRNC